MIVIEFLIVIVFIHSLAFTITWQFAQFVLLIQVMKIFIYLSNYLITAVIIMLDLCSPLPEGLVWT